MIKMTIILFYAIILISTLKNSSCFNDYFTSFDLLTFYKNNVNFTKNNEQLQAYEIKEYQNIRISIYDEDNNNVILCGNTSNGEDLISKLNFFTNNTYRLEPVFSERFIKDMTYHTKTKKLYWFNENNLKVINLTKGENNVEILNIFDVSDLKVDSIRNYLYWIEKTSLRKIKRINLNGIKQNNVEDFYTSNSIISSIDFDYQSHYIYWLEKSGLYFYLKRFDLEINQDSLFFYREISINPTNLNVINEYQFYWINNYNLHNISRQGSVIENIQIFKNISGFSVKKRFLFDQLKLNTPNSVPCIKKCENNGQCVIIQNNNGSYVQSCKCQDLFIGDLCQLKIDLFNFCSVICNLQSIDNNELYSFCNCKRNVSIFNTFVKTLKDVLLQNDTSLYVPSNYDYYYSHKIIIILLLIIIVQVLIIIQTVIKSCMKRNTKVRKRYLINKNYNKFPERQTEHCEIEIENCCNMNVCETPCFEPVQLKSVGSSRKVEDKRKLISHMESNEAS